MSIEEEAVKSIHRYVRSGFYGPDEIVEIIDEEIFEPGVVALWNDILWRYAE